MKHARPETDVTIVEWMPTGLKLTYANGTKDFLPDRSSAGYPFPAVSVPIPIPAEEVAPVTFVMAEEPVTVTRRWRLPWKC